MARRSRYRPPPPPDASGQVEAWTGERMMQCAWELRGDTVSIMHMICGAHGEARDPAQGSAEEQARAMIARLWEIHCQRYEARLKERGIRGAGPRNGPAGA